MTFFISSGCYFIFVSPGIDRYHIIQKETKYLRDRLHSMSKNKIFDNLHFTFDPLKCIQNEILKKHIALLNLIIRDNNKFILNFTARYFSVINFLERLNQAKPIHCDFIQMKRSTASKLIRVELQCLLK